MSTRDVFTSDEELCGSLGWFFSMCEQYVAMLWMDFDGTLHVHSSGKNCLTVGSDPGEIPGRIPAARPVCHADAAWSQFSKLRFSHKVGVQDIRKSETELFNGWERRLQHGPSYPSLRPSRQRSIFSLFDVFDVNLFIFFIIESYRKYFFQ